MDDPLAGNGTRQEGILDVSVAGDVSAQRFLLYVLLHVTTYKYRTLPTTTYLVTVALKRPRNSCARLSSL